MKELHRGYENSITVIEIILTLDISLIYYLAIKSQF